MGNQGVRELYGSEIIGLLATGSSYQQVGDSVGVSKQRIYELRRDHWFSFEFPDKHLVTTKKAIKMVGVSRDRFYRLIEVLRLKPFYSSPMRKLWRIETVELITFINQLSKVICQRCKRPLPKGYSGQICLECKRKNKQEYHLKYYTKHFRKSRIRCLKCGANLVGKKKRIYCEDCASEGSKAKRELCLN